MEEWDFIDERELQGWKGERICMTCQHFTYGIDQHCRTVLGCNLRRGQLQQREHRTKQCKYWSSVSDMKTSGRLDASNDAATQIDTYLSLI